VNYFVGADAHISLRGDEGIAPYAILQIVGDSSHTLRMTYSHIHLTPAATTPPFFIA